ncbi:serine-type carboxypeptidase [Metarhizium album ARSEF 1941]|uniref:Carboxypeptidase n=1 Tax=Metarhizium album (strain ARSEF 1941) TaxID=1081103 RepID=A0A0B2WXN3_METAS|nr:serine-type carboxypeptidase [Metarhizium album ARSEF 1941]KHO01052.1 serine-type carboxypeptidase [Metarhizium album ARSEF 1941]
MRRNQWMLSLLGLSTAAARARITDSHLRLLQHLHGNDVAADYREAQTPPPPSVYTRTNHDSGLHRFLYNDTEKFAVNGTGIPEVNFDIGESYAGRLPISDSKDERDSLFFWFFPTDNDEHKKKKEITLWLNGGPGCSSLLGLLQENGPFVWHPGTLKPVRNPWSWHHLTNIVWVEQPVTVGFSTGNTTIRNEDQLADQFLGFWKNFITAFGMQGYKVYVVGESYGGYYGSYIASHFVNANDTQYYNLQGMMVVDGISFDGDVQSEAIAETFVEQNYNLMPLDDRFRAQVHNTSEHCGYRDYVEKYYVYPPAGRQPSFLPWQQRLANGTVTYRDGCGSLWSDIYKRVRKDNPCFNIYNILDHCPDLFDPLGNDPYFNRVDVKKAIHAPLSVQWSVCVNTAFVKDDESLPPSKYELPNVIDKTRNVMYVQGGVDYILPANGVLLAVQNMTWGGKMGFQSRPTDPFYVPRYSKGKGSYGTSLPDKSGVVGTSHHERGFTVVVTGLSGHEGPQYASTAAFRQLEKLLGRVHSLSDTTPFTLPQLRNVTQDEQPLGKGTFPIPWVYTG